MTRTSKNTSKMHIILRWSILCAFLLFSTISLVIQSTKYRVQHVSDRLCLSSNKENFDAPHALKLNVQIRLFQAGTLNWLTNSNWIYKIEFIHVEFDMLSCFVWFEICWNMLIKWFEGRGASVLIGSWCQCSPSMTLRQSMQQRWYIFIYIYIHLTPGLV